MGDKEKVVRATRIQEGRPIKQFTEGRTCSAPGCDVVLSKYNPTRYCGKHADLAPIAHFRAS